MYNGLQTGNIKCAKFLKDTKNSMYKSLFNDSSTSNVILKFSALFKSICTKCTRIVSHVAFGQRFSSGTDVTSLYATEEKIGQRKT